MSAPMVTRATGSSLQRLAEESWDRVAAGSVLHYEGSHWTGTQLAERIRRVSGGLRAAGLRPGERVVVCMANCPEVGITYHAVWRAGAVATPVLFLLSENELRHVLADSGAVYVVTTPEFLPKVTAAAAGAGRRPRHHRLRRAARGGRRAGDAAFQRIGGQRSGRPGGR